MNPWALRSNGCIRISHDAWNLDRIIAEHADKAQLIDHVRRQGAVLCDITEQLSDATASVLMPVRLGGLISGLAENHIPQHAQQLRDFQPDRPAQA